MTGKGVAQLEARLAQPPVPGAFSEAEVEGLPAPLHRYFSSAIAPGTPLALSARLRMRGAITHLTLTKGSS
jgi:hypothetical protein